MSPALAVEQDLAKPIPHTGLSRNSTCKNDDDIDKDSWSAMPSLSQESAVKVSKSNIIF